MGTCRGTHSAAPTLSHPQATGREVLGRHCWASATEDRMLWAAGVSKASEKGTWPQQVTNGHGGQGGTH